MQVSEYKDLGWVLVKGTYGERNQWNKWSKINKDNFMEQFNDCTEKYNIAVITGKISNITVVDIDIYDKQKQKEFLNKYNLPNICMAKSASNGLHLYFKYTNELTTSTGVDIDIRNDNALIILPPSVASVKNKDKTLNYYKWINKPNNKNITDMPTNLINDLKKESKKKFDKNIILNKEYKVLSSKTIENILYESIDIQCPFKNRFHKSNHCKLITNLTTGKIMLGCHDDECPDYITIQEEYFFHDYNNDFFDKNIFNNLTTFKEKKQYFEMYHCKISNPICYVRYCYNDIAFYKTAQFCDLYRNLDNGWVRKWINDAYINEYNNLDFLPPPLKTPKHVYNTFKGLYVENIKANIVNIDIILNHFKILVNHDEKCFNYLMKWIAHMFQRPGELAKVALLFISEQGVGKNLIFEELIGQMLGDNLWFQTAEPDKVIGRFSMINNKIMIILDEINGKDSFLANDKIKNIITSPKLSWERKGIDGIKINNCARYIFFSNNDTPLKIELSDRRFVVFECDNSLRNDMTYFNNLLQAIKDINVVYSFYKYLMSIDLSNFNSILDRPTTEIYKDLQKINTPLIAKFLDWYSLTCQELTLTIQSQELYQLMTDEKNGWLYKNGYKDVKYTSTKFGRDLKKYKGIQKTRKSKGIYYKINIQELRDYMLSKDLIQND